MTLFLGIGVYGAQTLLIWFLVRKYFLSSWVNQSVRKMDLYWGFAIGYGVWIIANGFVLYKLPELKAQVNSLRSFIRFVQIFLFNSLPGALIEEYLFRYLPVRFAEHQGLSRPKTLLLFLAVLVFFTATHIPAYLWQYNISLWSLWSPFTMGAAFFFVYYATRNLIFTALFHAFTNQSWMLFGPANIKDYSFVIVVGIVWFLLRTNREAPSA